jgi:hypothetical protein
VQLSKEYKLDLKIDWKKCIKDNQCNSNQEKEFNQNLEELYHCYKDEDGYYYIQGQGNKREMDLFFAIGTILEEIEWIRPYILKCSWEIKTQNEHDSGNSLEFYKTKYNYTYAN